MRRTKVAFGVYIGRFEPPHNAHLAVMLEALERVHKLIVVIGSARSGRTPKNPFTAEERQHLITEMLVQAGVPRARILFTFVRDYFYNEALWLSEVQRGVAEHTKGSSDVALVGHIKDDSSYYLRSFPAWEYLPTRIESPLNATDIRTLYFQGQLENAEKYVPDTVAAYLEAFSRTNHFEELKAEFDYLRAYRAQWQGAPFAPVFVTTDAVVIKSGHVLLIRRAGQPGKGRLAMPGGFLDARQSLLASCLRVLREESGLGENHDLERFLRGSVVFDYPERSLRGRTITHAYHFDLGLGSLPVLRSQPGAGEALWMPLGEALAQNEAFFEDHHAIIEHFLMK
ncbi:bifunctional nicotinamide-nucleotide adenylyltransferase/Nudix hydroxylase [Deinococcus peraridilitoris]|uniref:Cytidyltransferase-related enzyme n=1 Tax=Deinococcus peraridilitoris (strain DSM 19664 / LMG 22246 / CIP 109416 / KR-200) TaxID=937777 RepID=L0A496_DEIPD|nr:bifunctional nicotinamide-nucleotide adenylyltransferase/Nudix hydroxylase [Deinococcus peraridilitoris]AFZ68007.1 cytidyltransferase-related enzyme [Deinococcus peraridilitoris DSM 19664]